jgi:predicted ATPase
MSNGSPLSLEELERRMAIVRDNIRQLIEQAAAFSGAEDEARGADRIAQQQEELDRLTKERDALQKQQKKR